MRTKADDGISLVLRDAPVIDRGGTEQTWQVEQLANKSSDTLTATPIVRGMMMPIDQDDYSVVVKLRALPPTPWKWEIYRAGRQSCIERAGVGPFFHNGGGKPGRKRSPQAAVGQTALSAPAIAGEVSGGPVAAPSGQSRLRFTPSSVDLLPASHRAPLPSDMSLPRFA
jgi:hypothetical protein